MTDDPREHERSNVFLGAALHASGKTFPVRVRNLSIAGALLDGNELPGEGVKVELRRGSLAVRGEVVWSGGSQRGIRFNEEIDVVAWVKPIGHAGQRRVDIAVESIRSREGPAPSDRAEAEQQTLESLSGQIQTIAERLASLPSITEQMGEELLQLEAIAHILRRIPRR